MRIALSSVHTHNWQSVWILYTPVTRMCACTHIHTPVWILHTPVGHEDVCMRTHTVSVRITLSPVHTHKWLSVWILCTPVSHEDGCACTHTHTHTHRTSVRTELSQVHTNSNQFGFCKHQTVMRMHIQTPTPRHTHTWSFYKNCTVSGSYTKTLIGLDPVNTSHEDETHAHTYT